MPILKKPLAKNTAKVASKKPSSTVPRAASKVKKSAHTTTQQKKAKTAGKTTVASKKPSTTALQAPSKVKKSATTAAKTAGNATTKASKKVAKE